MTKIGMIGAGSWGTALARVLANNGYEPIIWDLDSELLGMISEHRENRKYLSGVILPKAVRVAASREEALSGADMVVFAVPAQFFADAALEARPYLKDTSIIVNVAKGIEQGSLRTISQIAAEVIPDQVYAVLSGPSHAEEVARDLPTTVTVASRDELAAASVRDAFLSDTFRVYTNYDVIGLELGGALKNIIALGAGISDGMGYGDNTKAALMTRGLAEMLRLATALGASAETFYGLSGMGDLIVTCTSMHSRNRRCGIMIGEGVAPREAALTVGMVVEGMSTCTAAAELARREGVDMPITFAIERIINGEEDPKKAIKRLMTRQPKAE